MSSPVESIAVASAEDLILSALIIFLVYRLQSIPTSRGRFALVSFMCSAVRLIPYALWSRGFDGPPGLIIASAAAGFLTLAALTLFLAKASPTKALFAALGYALLLIIASWTVNSVTGQQPGLLQKSDLKAGEYIKLDSDQMFHGNDSWKAYLLEKGVAEAQIDAFPFRGGINQGETVRIVPADNVKLGDVIFYKTNEPEMQVVDRIIGVVEVRNWTVSSVNGTMGCLTEQEFTKSYLIPLEECIEKRPNCPYLLNRDDEPFRIYVTKGDNINAPDQCLGIFPVVDNQVLGKAVE